MLAAPLLTALYLGDGAGEQPAARHGLRASCCCREIFFYGLGAMFGAMLNTRGMSRPFGLGAGAEQRRRPRRARACSCCCRPDQPGPRAASATPAPGARRRHDAGHRRAGAGAAPGRAADRVPLPRRFGAGTDGSAGDRSARRLGARLRADQPGRLHRHDPRRRRRGTGSVAIYANAWLLLQVPYGVLGVSLLTALMPRMSRAAAGAAPPTCSTTSRSAPGCPRSCCCRSARC